VEAEMFSQIFTKYLQSKVQFTPRFLDRPSSTKFFRCLYAALDLIDGRPR
jgi:hypothetical protein